MNAQKHFHWKVLGFLLFVASWNDVAVWAQSPPCAPSRASDLASCTMEVERNHSDSGPENEALLGSEGQEPEAIDRRSGLFELERAAVHSGGNLASGGGFALLITVAQSTAAEPSQGAGFSMEGGFLTRSVGCGLFCDGFESGDTSGWTITSPP